MLVKDYIKKMGKFTIEDPKKEWKFWIDPERNTIGGKFKKGNHIL